MFTFPDHVSLEEDRHQKNIRARLMNVDKRRDLGRQLV